jgi:hypothetical protein
MLKHVKKNVKIQSPVWQLHGHISEVCDITIVLAYDDDVYNPKLDTDTKYVKVEKLFFELPEPIDSDSLSRFFAREKSTKLTSNSLNLASRKFVEPRNIW